MSSSDKTTKTSAVLTDYLKSSGDTMTGNLIMSGQQILDTETSYPPIKINNTQAVNFNQLTTAVSAGGTMTGNIDMSGNKITNHSISYALNNANNTQAVSYNQLTTDVSNNLRLRWWDKDQRHEHNSGATDAVSYDQLKGSLAEYSNLAEER
ncbi:hypothetical protein CHS0354_015377 [Potamilus streckersoni]|uniref:Uncharacterized protein n=1 Tax=Potamilus streckersoni TaxID=2493646 RepID=A0AAE0VM11_9BIVA|nr:hypothetical protein CHS0354_015377 [Potamilus streckersoni]